MPAPILGYSSRQLPVSEAGSPYAGRVASTTSTGVGDDAAVAESALPSGRRRAARLTRLSLSTGAACSNQLQGRPSGDPYGTATKRSEVQKTRDFGSGRAVHVRTSSTWLAACLFLRHGPLRGVPLSVDTGPHGLGAGPHRACARSPGGRDLGLGVSGAGGGRGR